MARPHPALIELAALRPMPAVSDFDELLRSAVEHRMVGVLFREIEGGRVSGPADWVHRLAAIQLQNRARSRRQAAAAQEVLASLAEVGVEGALFKGIAAEVRWYDGVGDRPAGDLDVFIPPQFVDRAHDILVAVNPDDPLKDAVQKLVERGAIQSATTTHRSETVVDIHFDPLKMGTQLRQGDVLWDRTVAVELPGGGRCRAFDAETSLIQFLVHLNRDKFADLLGCTDVVRVLDRSSIDWGFVDHFVHAEGIDTHVYLSLEAVLDSLALPQLRPRARGWRATTWRVLWPERIRLRGSETWLRWRRRAYLRPLLSSGPRSGVLTWWWYQMFPPSEVVDRYYSLPGRSYIWRLSAGRLQRLLQRMRVVRRLRRHVIR